MNNYIKRNYIKNQDLEFQMDFVIINNIYLRY